MSLVYVGLSAVDAVACPACRAAIRAAGKVEGGRFVVEGWVWRGRKTCPHTAKQQKEPIRGLGDVIATVTKAAGIKECGGCARRRAALNRLFPRPGA